MSLEDGDLLGDLLGEPYVVGVEKADQVAALFACREPAPRSCHGYRRPRA